MVWITAACACAVLLESCMATYGVAGDSAYPNNYVYDVTLQNEQLVTENAHLREQMLKLDHKQACLDARRSLHRVLCFRH